MLVQVDELVREGITDLINMAILHKNQLKIKSTSILTEELSISFTIWGRMTIRLTWSFPVHLVILRSH